MERIVDWASPSIPLILLLISYLSVFGFGLYSLLNFFSYATVAQNAEWKIKDVKKTEHDLLEGIRKDRSWISTKFAYLKVLPPVEAPEASKQNQGCSKWSAFARRFNHRKDTIFVVFYFVIGLLPLFALWIAHQ